MPLPTMEPATKATSRPKPNVSLLAGLAVTACLLAAGGRLRHCASGVFAARLVLFVVSNLLCACEIAKQVTITLATCCRSTFSANGWRVLNAAAAVVPMLRCIPGLWRPAWRCRRLPQALIAG